MEALRVLIMLEIQQGKDEEEEEEEGSTTQHKVDTKLRMVLGPLSMVTSLSFLIIIRPSQI